MVVQMSSYLVREAKITAIGKLLPHVEASSLKSMITEFIYINQHNCVHHVSSVTKTLSTVISLYNAAMIRSDETKIKYK